MRSEDLTKKTTSLMEERCYRNVVTNHCNLVEIRRYRNAVKIENGGGCPWLWRVGRYSHRCKMEPTKIAWFELESRTPEACTRMVSLSQNVLSTAQREFPLLSFNLWGKTNFRLQVFNCLTPSSFFCTRNVWEPYDYFV